ncbi:outer membrane protein assembly factor BamB family protein [Phaeacidiphilus oryzae]|uniref:outer membrane protein assembly factor BamB family protein n=1 Tax=Phaeacidiphilus oryzae TaxID=348818 RepID=UPI00055C84ED|nr:PQQ-binding-like beta-propeller repeat protein [Phaeacidiphilus oryzae]
MIGGGALAVLVVAGVLVAGNGPGGTGTPGAAGGSASADLAVAHTKAWSAPADASAGSNQDGLLGGWITGNAVVRGDGTAVTAYSASDGHKLWTVAAPSANAVPCGMSPEVNSAGLGAVLYQPKPGTGQPCTSVVAVDTATGRTKWTKSLSSGSSGYDAAVSVTDNRVIAVGDDQAVGYDSGSGAQKWTYAGPGKFCTLAGDGGSSTVLVQATCADTSSKQQLVQLDATSGKMNWWRGLPGDAASFTVLSAQPIAVGVNYTDTTKNKVMSFSQTGSSQPDIPLAQSGGTLAAAHGAFDPTPGVWFQGTTMVAALTPAAGSGSPSAATTVAAYDLSTGKREWLTKLTEQGQSAPVGIDGQSVVMATEERTGQQARLSKLALGDGKETQGGGFPNGTGSLLTSGRVVMDNDLIATLPAFTTTYATAVTAYRNAG